MIPPERTTPPEWPDSATDNPTPEMLYEQGLAYYQRREWRAALQNFKRLESVQPNWPGLDSLIDEVSWFLQLEEVDAGSGSPSTSEPPASRRTRLAWTVPVLVVAALLLVLGIWRGWIPGIGKGSSLQVDALYNRGQSSLAVGDYESARDAFTELARLAPGSAAAQEGLERAARLEALALTYQAAQDAIDQEDWATAESKLADVVAIDPTYADASELLAFAEHQRAASDLFRAGVAAYDEGDLAQAIAHLERLTELDPSFQRSTVRELLFVLYMADGRALLAGPEPSADVIRQALGRFGKALALRPRNVQAAEEGGLANQFLNARQALDRGDWRQAQDLLVALMSEREDYADGQAAQLLYLVLVRKGDEARSAGQWAVAAAAYNQALDLPGGVVSDRSAAEKGNELAQSQLTPTPTATPSASPTAEAPAQAIVEVETLNVRLGPGTDYPIAGQASLGDLFILVGRNEAGDWLVVCCIGADGTVGTEGQPGWVATRLVTLSDGVDASLLPVALAPTRVPTATATATPTATPTPVEVDTPTPPPSQPDRSPPSPTPTIVPR